MGRENLARIAASGKGSVTERVGALDKRIEAAARSPELNIVHAKPYVQPSRTEPYTQFNHNIGRTTVEIEAIETKLHEIELRLQTVQMTDPSSKEIDVLKQQLAEARDRHGVKARLLGSLIMKQHQEKQKEKQGGKRRSRQQKKKRLNKSRSRSRK
jgi:hypothetical protein